MTLSDTFIQIFDKSKTRGHAVECTDSWMVTEHDAKATMNSLKVNAKGQFLAFDHDLVKSMPDISTKLSSYLEDKDCDGIAFLRDNHGQEHLVFTELKSNFDTYKITEAFHQIIMSFLKMHSFLSLCKNYNLSDIIVHFIVACKCCKDKNQATNVLLRVSQAQQLSNKTFESKFLKPLLDNHCINVNMSSYGDIQRLPFHDSICGKNVNMYLQLTQNPEDNQTSLTLVEQTHT